MMEFNILKGVSWTKHGGLGDMASLCVIRGKKIKPISV